MEFNSGQGKCVVACGQLPRVLLLTHYMQGSSLLGKVLHQIKSQQEMAFECI